MRKRDKVLYPLADARDALLTKYDLLPRFGQIVTIGLLIISVIIAGIGVATLFTKSSRSPVEEKLETLRESIQNDIEVASNNLPEGVVGNVVPDSTGNLVGTLASFENGTCLGFTVTVPQEYLSTGKQDNIQVGELRQLTPQACTPGATGE